ncbi:transmembrane and TPR repeat-containing protein 4-like [Ctenocephalides felis]|uniref:transmembrane and TPR repeat-containing protein 4-like n=1 Tax=Ctenocephalides felis TaxID=7515 RepID=UPI000E6E44C2|nr:transmembrane and TPR repeat-containing protein 4-like [Ctenocephalides felis]
MKFNKKSLEVFLIIITACLCYGFTLQGNFVFDDFEAVVNNDDVKWNDSIINIFKHDFWGANISNPLSHKSYRPLTVFTFRLNNYFSGSLNSTHMKITNFILYLVVCLLVYYVYKLIADVNSIPFISAILFASHPIHTEAVSSIVGRAELLSSFFCCIAFILYNRSIDVCKIGDMLMYCILSTFFVILSLLSKENGVMIIVVCLTYDILNQWQSKQNSNKNDEFRKIRFALLTSSMILLIFWRMHIINFETPIFQKMDNHIAFCNDKISKILSQLYLYSLNIWLLLCPIWLCCDWSFECVPLLTICDIRIITIPAPWIIIGLIIYYQKRFLLNGLIFMIIPFLPASGIITVGFVIAERVLFIPSIGFCLMLGFSIQNISKYFFKTAIFCYVALICLWIVRTNMRAAEWSNSTVLFDSGAKVCPQNAKIHYNRALTASTNNDNHKAELLYLEALRQYPEYEQALNNLANLLRDAKRFEEAESYLRKAVHIRPSFGAAWMNLGIVLSQLGEFLEAEHCYKKSLHYRPKHVDTFYNLGNLYLSNKQYREAKSSWLQATRIDSSHAKSWINLITLLDSQGKNEEVKKLASRALNKLPNEPGLHFLLANAYGKSNQYEMAESHFKSAISIKHDALYFANLGVLYHRWNKTNLAETMYKEALKINPTLKSANDNYNKLLHIKSRRQH